MPGMVPAYKRIAVGDIHKGGIPVYQTNPMVSPLQHTSLMQLQQQPNYIPMSYGPAYMYPPASGGLDQQSVGAPASQLPPTLAALSPTLLPTVPRPTAATTKASSAEPVSTTPSTSTNGTLETGGGGGGGTYLLSTPAAAAPSVLPTTQSVFWGADSSSLSSSMAGLSPGYYQHVLQQQQQHQHVLQQQQQSRLASVAGLGLYAAPLASPSVPSSAQVASPAAKAASPGLPSNACYVEYFGNNKQAETVVESISGECCEGCLSNRVVTGRTSRTSCVRALCSVSSWTTRHNSKGYPNI
ncbi:hypothetical protein EGW08_008852 [Elysia chlorotica]|uniref:Uncharacterized protein n=1 Tax=Elysia chlorotica TaxID=188477 RepID=A0A433TPG4_ELYCH|nr:hypothetical protein EGW08_008852 [Elysia chlorotica]